MKEAKEFLSECYSENPRLKKYPFSEWQSALEKEKLQLSSFRGKYFFRLNKEFKSFQAGTVFGKNFFVPGYPSIPRIFLLKTGIKRYLEYPFYAEEKIEGYNIRLAKVEDEILTFTRRGFVCPFAYDRYADFLPRLPEFFDRSPSVVVCAELAGPENPFVSEFPPQVKEDVCFFVFDFYDTEKGVFLVAEEKLKLLKEYAFPHPEIFGPLDPDKDYERLRSLILRYHREGREGLVFKPEGAGRRVKYVTPYSNLADLKVVFPYLGEVDPNFVSLRLIRLLLGIHEFTELKDEVMAEVGRYMFEEALKSLNLDQPSYEVFRLRFRDEANFLALLSHFKQTRVNIEVLEKRWEGSYLRVAIKKIYPKATQFWRSKLEGWGEVD